MFNSSIKGRFTILYLLGGAVTLRYVLSLKTCNRVFESRCGTFFSFSQNFMLSINFE